MPTLQYYVNTDTAAGGTGLTPSLYGPDRAFATSSAAETALRQNLTSIAPDVDTPRIALRVRCAGTAADTSLVTFTNASWVTDSEHRIEWAGEWGQPRWNDKRYRIVTTSGYGIGTINVGKAVHLRLTDLQLESTSTLDQRPCCLGLNAFAWDVEVLGGFFRLTGTTGTIDVPSAIKINSTAAYRLVVQNVTTATEFGGGLDTNEAINGNTGTVFVLSNCTMVQRRSPQTATAQLNLAGVDTFGDGSGNVRLRNLILQAPERTLFSGGSYDEVINLVTSDGYSPTVALRNTRLRFMDPLNWDYRLHPSDLTRIGSGVNLRDDPYGLT